ncbi:Integration host factor subunit beta [Gemmata sp. SH-PL17]|uniref:HU family DNA-binding protein n=1 Tax=Gemmata sp. SH-PL17 TaxID=1630693 RepID=UPI00078E0DAC|nr:HU family DNA-binding protein [Gemmata sp. SH-PL17]AMV28016.1 Integration host factor subunit beta [Gemmata sp. SH-PL17]
MTKKEIVKTICDRANHEKLIPKHSLTQLATKEIVQWTFEAIIATLVQEGRIELRNFGVFEVKQRRPRKARNPRTGDPVNVEAKNVVTFQPGKMMEEQVKKSTKIAEVKKKKPRKSKADKAAARSAEPKTAPAPIAEPSANGNGTVPTETASVPAVVSTVTKSAVEPVTSDAPAAT